MLAHGSPNFCDKGPHRLLGACSRAVRGKITKYGKPKHLNYCDIFKAHKQFINVAAVRTIQPAGPRIEDPIY